ncbi:MAG: hypothetical protein HQL02_02735 [Nitrospirae bacterium]|nr:hypothetical protein [Nitrospirota bacterium]
MPNTKKVEIKYLEVNGNIYCYSVYNDDLGYKLLVWANQNAMIQNKAPFLSKYYTKNLTEKEIVDQINENKPPAAGN